MPVADQIEIRPQPGPQEHFLGTEADIGIMGGAAGGGKTWSLLLEPVRHRDVPDFGAVIFRRTYPEIVNKGGLWDESQKLYGLIDEAKARESTLEWEFSSGATVKFAHLQFEKDVQAWKGAQIPLLGFDQIEGFTEHQFWYLLSRNRSMSGVRPYVRATCNPVPEDDPIGGWLNTLIAWWINPKTGYPLYERSGVLRWFVRPEGAELHWGDSKEVLERRYPGTIAKSLTFVPARLEDNPALEKADPGYRANLMALTLVERERLLEGNWHARPTSGKVFNRALWQFADSLHPAGKRVRYWDKAGTEDGGMYSCGVKLCRDGSRFTVEDVVRGQWAAREREQVIRQTALMDGPDVEVRVEQEPGSGGKESAENTVRNLIGFTVSVDRVTGDKATRANPYAAQHQGRNITLFRADWNKAYIDELHSFPDGKYKDQVDASSGAFNYLAPIGELVLRCNGQSSNESNEPQPVSAIINSQGVYWPRGR